MNDFSRLLGEYAHFFSNADYPEFETENSDVILFECINAAGGITALCAAIESTLVRRVGIAGVQAHELAMRIKRLATETIGGDTSLYQNDDALLREATEAVNAAVHADHTYDIPALAGYSVFTPKKVYIDRGLRAAHTFPFLVLHEVIEKALMDELHFDERSYQRTHQVAQRIEQAAVGAAGLSWSDYQEGIMLPEIERAYFSTDIKHVPLDLDLAPYVDTDEYPMVQKLQGLQGLSFVAKKIFDGLYHLRFDDPARMALTMMRFQESYESPEFRGRVFSREEFEQWYAARKGSFTYAQDWGDGFNMPSSALVPFYEGKFDSLTADESSFLRYFETVKDEPFYLIATATSSANGTLDHEIAHALYFLNPDYKGAVDTILSRIDTPSVKRFLATVYGDYHEAVLDDEAHAYLGHSSEHLEHDGLDLAPYRDAIGELKRLYRSHLR